MVARLPELAVYGPAYHDISGVSNYLDSLEPYLSSHFRVRRMNNENWESPRHFDYVLYNLGNNALHDCAFSAQRERPGPTVIHEFNCCDYYLSCWEKLPESEKRWILDVFSKQLGTHVTSAAEILSHHSFEGGDDIYSMPVPFETLYMPHVTSAITHSPDACQKLHAGGVGERFFALPHPVEEIEITPARRAVIREELKVADNAFIFGSFGFIGEYKRLEKVIEAFIEVYALHPDSVLLVVGALQYELQIPECKGIRHLGYFEDVSAFDELLASVDCGVQLRYPCLGESSASIAKLLAHGKSIISTDTPLLSYLRQYENVSLVAPDAQEVPGLVRLMLERIGEEQTGGVQYQPEFSPVEVAGQMARIIRGEQWTTQC